MLIFFSGDDNKNTQAALRVVGNITTGTDSQTQQIIDEGGLIKLKTLLKHDQAVMQKETCWALSNITAGTIDQKQVLMVAIKLLLLTRAWAEGYSNRLVCLSVTRYAPKILCFTYDTIWQWKDHLLFC